VRFRGRKEIFIADLYKTCHAAVSFFSKRVIRDELGRSEVGSREC